MITISASTFWSFLPLVLMTAALIVGVVVAWRLWNDMHGDEGSESGFSLLEELERAHAEGELDDAELRRVREHLSQRQTESAGHAPLTAQKPTVEPPGAHDAAASSEVADGTGDS